MCTYHRRIVFACQCCISGLEARVSDFADEGDSEVQRCRVEAASDNFGIEATQDFTFRLAGKSLHLFFYWVRNSNGHYKQQNHWRLTGSTTSTQPTSGTQLSSRLVLTWSTLHLSYIFRLLVVYWFFIISSTFFTDPRLSTPTSNLDTSMALQ